MSIFDEMGRGAARAKERVFVFAMCFVIATVGLAGDGAASPLNAVAIAAVFASATVAVIVIADRHDREER